MNFTRSEHVSLKFHPELNEKWVQELIAADPSILGLGELVLRNLMPRSSKPESKHSYAARWGAYRLSLHRHDITKHRELLKELMQAAYQTRSL